MSDDGIPLVDVLRALRAQLTRAAAEGQGADIRFEIGSVEVELAGTIGREGSGEAAVEFRVLGFGPKLGAAGKLSDEQTHRIKLTLTPKMKGGGPIWTFRSRASGAVGDVTGLLGSEAEIDWGPLVLDTIDPLKGLLIDPGQIAFVPDDQGGFVYRPKPRK